MGVEEDTKSAVDTLHSVSDLLDKRWSATFQMVGAIENAKAGDELKAAKDTYLSVNHEWELGFANVYSAVQFNVDRPFDIGMSRIPEALWTLNCDTFRFGGEEGGTLEPGSAHIMLKLIDHCHGLVKTDIDELSKGSIDQPKRLGMLISPPASMRTVSSILCFQGLKAPTSRLNHLR
jgi:hypothetical protein